MKKWLAAVLCVLLAGLCACGQAEPAPETTKATMQATTTVTTSATTTAAPTTTEPPTLEPIECPASYKDAPEAYWPILDNLYTFVYFAHQDDPDLTSDAFYKTGIPNFSVHFTPDDLGYAIADINNDGILELLILRKGGNLLSLYTLKDDNPVFLLGDWGSRTTGGFWADGTLYTQWSSGSGMWLCNYRLEPGAGKLTEVESNFFEFMYDTHILHFKNADGEGERPFTDEEFRAMSAKPTNPIKFSFIPIEQ